MASGKIEKQLITGVLTGSDSVDNATKAGIYQLDGTDSYNFYGLLVVSNDNSGKIYQLFIQNDGNSPQVRFWDGSSWGSWNTLHKATMLQILHKDYSQRNEQQLIESVAADSLQQMKNRGISSLKLEGNMTGVNCYGGYVTKYADTLCSGILNFGTRLFLFQNSNGTITYKEFT